MLCVMYGDFLGSTLISGDIIDDLFLLNRIIKELKFNGFKYISHNKEGIIYDYSPSELKVISDSTISEINLELKYLKETLENLKANTNNKEEVTEEFYILFDLLPKHIKNELKIYIQK